MQPKPQNPQKHQAATHHAQAALALQQRERKKKRERREWYLAILLMFTFLAGISVYCSFVTWYQYQQIELLKQGDWQTAQILSYRKVKIGKSRGLELEIQAQGVVLWRRVGTQAVRDLPEYPKVKYKRNASGSVYVFEFENPGGRMHYNAIIALLALVILLWMLRQFLRRR